MFAFLKRWYYFMAPWADPTKIFIRTNEIECLFKRAEMYTKSGEWVVDEPLHLYFLKWTIILRLATQAELEAHSRNRRLRYLMEKPHPTQDDLIDIEEILAGK